MSSQNRFQKKNFILLQTKSEDLQDQSRLILAKLGERKYEKSFIAKLTDSEGEARETQTWLQFSLACTYINEEQFNNLNNQYNQIIGMLVSMINQSEKWTSFSSVSSEIK